jgi:alpha-tubulin suppressor-like RCC1 family protein
VLCWGNNRYGQAGFTGDTEVISPTPHALAEPVGLLSLSHRASLAITTSGALWGWGLDDDAVLLSGDGTSSVHTNPLRAALREPVRLAVAGSRHACAVTATGRLYCAGANSAGEFGIDYAPDSVLPLEVDAARAIAPDIVSMVLGTSGSILAGGFTCVATRDRVTRCTGVLPFLPAGTRAFTPVDALRGALRLYTTTFANYMGPAAYVCALRDDLTVRCLNGRTAAVGPRDLPFTNVFSLALGTRHFCALRADGSVECLGDNSLGQLGTGDTVSSETPQRVSFPP